MKKLVLFASGSGSNVERIIDYFKEDPVVTIACVLTNRKDAQVLERCKRLGVPALYFNRSAFYRSNTITDFLTAQKPNLIVLAGFLWKIPETLIMRFPNSIINIHPSLLPKYGGKGMYGHHVHQAVKNNKETQTGITIHYVNEHYDDGGVIHQAKVQLQATDTVDTIAKKVHALEYEHFPKVIAALLKDHGQEN